MVTSKTVLSSHHDVSKFLKEFGADQEYINKFDEKFSSLREVYCKETNQEKIKSVQGCLAPAKQNLPEEVEKCRLQVYKKLSPFKIRDIECMGGKEQQEVSKNLNLCIIKALDSKDKTTTKSKGIKGLRRKSKHQMMTTISPTTEPDSVITQNKQEVLNKVIESIDYLEACYEKALS